MKRWRPFLILFMAFAMVIAAGAPVSAKGKTDKVKPFRTDAPSMLSAAARGVSIRPIITVGDELSNGYRFESLPDGIAIDPRKSKGAYDVYINHETSSVPFRGLADFENAQLSKLTLKKDGKVRDASVVIDSDSNYLRFCSNYMGTRAEGFSRPLLLTNEETSDFVNRTGDAWPPGPDAEQAGLAVAYDPDTGENRPIPGMGRHNHENSVPIPGYDQIVILSGDDTFSAPSSQLYMYAAKDRSAVWNDEGSLWAFVGDGANDYGDLVPGASISGNFIPVPRSVAVDDQSALEDWSNDNDVFQFIRVEDIAYDKNTSNVVYIADTGEPRAVPDPATGRLMRAPSGTQGPYPNGRIFKMVLDPDDPTVVESLSIFINGDALLAASAGRLDLIHNPDNIETTKRSLMIQEDPGGQNSYDADDPNGTTARIWRYDLHTGDLTVVARVDQSLDPTEDQGDWESSGIVDASAIFGKGAFLVDIQAHSLLIATNEIDDPTSDDPADTILQKREGGQLLLLKIDETPKRQKPSARFATYNASLNRFNEGDLVTELSTPGSAQPATIAEVIQRTRPDVLLVNEFDFDAAGDGARLFQENYLGVSQNGAWPIEYPYRFVAPSNTGVPSGEDLDNDGSIGGPGDAFGFGFFPGQFGMAVFSMYPIDHDDIRTFQNFLWKDMPGALLPVDPGTGDGWYSDEELDVFRLSSKSHWDVPIEIGRETVHFLVSHPTPPVFDGPEDRNGTRNHEEIRFWADYITPGRTSRYIYDDDGGRGGLRGGALFVIAGDQNSDPLDGDSIPGSIQQLTEHRRITDPLPTSEGGPEADALQGGANESHLNDPKFDTADFSDFAPGNLRADYVLPRKGLRVADSGVFWPVQADALSALTGTFPFPSSDHRLVWVDLSRNGFGDDRHDDGRGDDDDDEGDD